MKDMNRLTVRIMLLYFVLAVCLNICAVSCREKEAAKTYKISLNRAGQALEAFEQEKERPAKNLQELADFSGSEYPELEGLSVTSRDFPQESFWQNGRQDYAIVATEKFYYKLSYEIRRSEQSSLLWLNAGIALFLSATAGVLFSIRKNILKPFFQLSQLPYELSRGNLTIPLKENKNRYFGKFLWGLDLLREKLEEQKKRELELLREKKMLLLSLSHDIKTPLSAIKLYAKALSRNLYRQEEKKREIAENINGKADEIERYISEIVRASSEDFLDFQVRAEETYVRNILNRICNYYEEKMALSQISFQVGACPECLVYADPGRLEEVLQNVIENAMKYGDGKLIEISARREEEEYLIFVRNSGSSLPARELPHIFDSFFRGSNVNAQAGSGLGLYICRQLMHRMEGEITAAKEKREGGNNEMIVTVALRIV